MGSARRAGMQCRAQHSEARMACHGIARTRKIADPIERLARFADRLS